MTRTLTVLFLSVASVAAQDLVYSLAYDLPGLPYELKKSELQRLRPGGGTAPFIPVEAWRVLFGDRDGNGVYDDAPSDIDALHIRNTRGGLASWLMSTSVTTPLAGGGALKDGVIEIQGDHREVLVAELETRGYRVKLDGG